MTLHSRKVQPELKMTKFITFPESWYKRYLTPTFIYPFETQGFCRLPLAVEVWGKVMILLMFVCPGGLCMMSLPIWLHRVKLLLRVSVKGPRSYWGSMQREGNLCERGISMKMVSVKGESLWKGVCEKGLCERGGGVLWSFGMAF